MKNLVKIISASSDFSKSQKISDTNVALFYKLGRENLIKHPTTLFIENQILGITDIDFNGVFNMKKLIDDVVFEYQKNKCLGIYLDFHSENSVELVAVLDDLCFRQGFKLYVPMPYANSVKNSILVFDMAISGGNIKNILEYTKMQNPNFAIKISHQCRKFEIPSADTQGELLPYPIDTFDKNVFFSENLCTNYFTYMKNTETCIFSIFDDEKSLGAKLDVVKSLEINDIFMDFPDALKYGIIS